MLSLFPSKRLGWLPNPTDHRDRDLNILGLGEPSRSRAITVADWAPPMYDQGKSNACVGYGMAAQLEILHRQTYGGLSKPSPVALYTASLEMHTSPGARLRDDGTYPRLAAKALRAVGAANEADWPASNIGKRLPFRIAVQANGRKGAEYAFIKGSGDARIDGIRAALAAGYPVGFGAKVAKSYLKNQGPEMVGLPLKGDPIVGGHYQVIVGVTANQNFRVRNSWGATWRDSGYCWMTAEYITSALCADFMVIYGWESVRDARPSFSL